MTCKPECDNEWDSSVTTTHRVYLPVEDWGDSYKPPLVSPSRSEDIQRLIDHLNGDDPEVQPPPMSLTAYDGLTRHKAEHVKKLIKASTEDPDPDLKLILDTCRDLYVTLQSKGSDYGHTSGAFGTFERVAEDLGIATELAVEVELTKKYNRFLNLRDKAKTNEAPKHESMDDTLLDLAGYTIILLALRKKGRTT